MARIKTTTVTEYIASYPDAIQQRLLLIRSTFQKLAPHATEKISYGIPTICYNNKMLMHFAAYKEHIGIYALPEANVAFQEELLRYKIGKRSIQFPHSEPLPIALIEKIIKFRITEVGKM